MAATAKPKKSKSSEAPAQASAANTPAAFKPYVVFARRFRPQTFADVAGQSAVTGALRQALSSGRLGQAYMLCGPRGVGKTSLARIFAKACNCLQGTGPNGVAEEPCNTCDACVSIQNGSALDVIEMDAATNRGIEEVRSLRENVGIAPAQLRYKIYIIDEVHMLTREAWNAFLKTLEEPPAHVKFIFATTDPNDVPETILSRCQRFDLKRISLADIVKRLEKICEADKLEYEDAALSRIAGLSKGGLRDAEGLLDQAVNLGVGKVSDAVIRELSGAAPDETVFEILNFCASGNAAGALGKAHETLEAGTDPDDLLSVMCERLRCAVLSRVCGADSPLLEGQTHLKESYAALAANLNEDQSLLLIQLFTHARSQIRDASQTRLPLEVALIRAARAKDLVDLGKLASVLEANAGKSPAPAAHAGAQQNRPPGPPGTEGQRPNWAGRPATVDTRPAASPRIPNPPAPAQNTAAAPVASQIPVQPRAAITAQPMRAAPQEPPPWDDLPANLTDDYLDDGALPLTARAPSAEGDAAPLTSENDNDDDPPPPQSDGLTPVILAQRAAAPAPPARSIDSRLVEDHPLVKLLLKETAGLLIEVTRAKG